jgi:hypothetical protein
MRQGAALLLPNLPFPAIPAITRPLFLTHHQTRRERLYAWLKSRVTKFVPAP